MRYFVLEIEITKASNRNIPPIGKADGKKIIPKQKNKLPIPRDFRCFDSIFSI